MRRWVKQGALTAVTVLAVAVAVLLVDGWFSFGARSAGARRGRMEQSPQWRDGHFVNPEPLINDWSGALTGLANASDDLSPKVPVPTAPLDVSSLKAAPDAGLRITWLGHSTTLIELDGHRIITDPALSARAGHTPGLGPPGGTQRRSIWQTARSSMPSSSRTTTTTTSMRRASWR